jgi:hypothetical protein
MSKPLVGHHLLRVRIKKRIFRRLKEVAQEEAERTGEHVTVSDLVRAACYNYLLIHDSVQQLENRPPTEIDEEVLVIGMGMLSG